MRKAGYPPPLDDDKILDAPPGLDMEGLGARDVGLPGRSGRHPARRRPLARRLVRALLPFLLGIGAGGFLYYHFVSERAEGTEARSGLSLFSYPVSGLRLERASREGGASGPAMSRLLSPGETAKVRYGKESLRYVAMERRSTPWAALLAMFVKPPALYMDGRPVEPGLDLTSLLEPERSVSPILVLKSSDGDPPVASFRLDVEMDGRAWLERSRELKDPQSQRECLEQALRNEPENVEILMALGNLLWEQKDPSAASQRFREVIKQNPNHVEAARALASIYWKAQPKKALETYETLVKIDPEHRVENYKQMAQLQERLGISPAETYRKILSLQKNDPDAKRGLDNLYSKELERAQQWEKKGDLTKAIQEMKQAIELHPSKEGQAYLGTLYNNLAYSLAQKGKFNEAIPNYEASLKIDENAVTYLNLADAYAKANQVPNALKAVEKAYNLKPKDQTVAKNILLLWAELHLAKKDYGQAIPRLEELHKGFPKDPQIAKTLGTAYWNKGDLARALDTLKEIPPLLSSRPPKEQAEIHRMIGDLYRSMGDQEKNLKTRISRYDQALQSYKQCLALSKGDKEIQKRKDELENERMALVKRSLKSP